MQEAAADGTLSVATIYPGCCAGRWPHMHFAVSPSLAEATRAGRKLVTSQIALPKAACDTVYATDGYAASAANLSGLSNETDMVFSDGFSTQLGTVTGTPGTGMALNLNVWD